MVSFIIFFITLEYILEKFIKFLIKIFVMVIKKVKEFFSGNDEKYEVLYYKYSQVKVENQKLKEQHRRDLAEYKERTYRKVADHIIALYEDIEVAKSDSFKVKSIDQDLQRLLMDINRVEKSIKELMIEYSLEEITPSERFYDPEIHEVATYEDSKGMAKGMILKTVKKGFRFKNQIIKKPKVVVTK